MHNYPYPDSNGRSLTGDQSERYAVRDRHGSTATGPSVRVSSPKERSVVVKVKEGSPTVKVTKKAR